MSFWCGCFVNTEYTHAIHNHIYVLGLENFNLQIFVSKMLRRLEALVLQVSLVFMHTLLKFLSSYNILICNSNSECHNQLITKMGASIQQPCIAKRPKWCFCVFKASAMMQAKLFWLKSGHDTWTSIKQIVATTISAAKKKYLFVNPFVISVSRSSFSKDSLLLWVCLNLESEGFVAALICTK